MTQTPLSSLPGLAMDQYRIQKIALEESVKQIRNHKLGVGFTIVRPGNIATDPTKTVPPAADVNNWARTLINLLDMAKNNNLKISDISLGPI
jgi:sugar phosphate isomerase/epimerase